MNAQAPNGPGSKALLAAVIGMGVLLAVGSLVLVGVLVHRISHPHSVSSVRVVSPPDGAYGPLVLDEPAGTHITAMARQDDAMLAVSLSGGGPDRIVLWDLAHARVAGRLTLAR
ncbi:conserved hypothetical protein [Gluconacetobacter diazotrophicus PA1 5]|uniref:Uncharacterized protein n=2 Tax=Gluconacetobacter diazotrophicus TaxID=33996 RepID=A0A7W4I3H1_GLUDI|nr:hypothetical protein [Gluconacetobacter diazotrophicus]ACI50268.1 conserved hypothetical protein [Gluconacetobacter diazotrophicus PA1 5]MBB2154786.1 hypothetical protein [Gluconacetobacter diazotrophicus]TWB08410.1 hypothetical protein FBZ86_107150 [Gluconacetobacter diazotrophicus]